MRHIIASPYKTNHSFHSCRDWVECSCSL